MKRRRARKPFSLFAFQDLVTGLSGVMILLVLTMSLDVAAERKAEGDRGAALEGASADAAVLEGDIRRLRKELEALKETAESVRVAAREKASAEENEAAREAREEAERAAGALRSRVEALEQRLELARKAEEESRSVLVEMETARKELESELEALRKRPGITLIPERGNLKLPIYVVCGEAGFSVHRPLDADVPEGETAGDEEGLVEVLEAMDRRTHSVVLLVRPSGVQRMQGAAQLARDLGFAVGRDPLEEDMVVDFAGAAGRSE